MDKATPTYFLNSVTAASGLNKDIWSQLKPCRSILIYAVIGSLIGIIALSFSLKITLGLFFLLILGVVGLMKPEVVAIALALLLPFHLEWEMPQLAGIKVGTTSLLVAVGLISILFNQFLNRKTRLPRIPHIIPWLLLALFMCAAYIHSPDFSPDPVKIPWHLYRSVLRFLLIFPLLFILIKTKSENLAKWITLALLISATLIASVGIIQTALKIPIHPFHFGVALEMLNSRPDVQEFDQATGILRAFGSFTHPNAFAGFLVIAIPLSIGILFSAQKNSIWYLALMSASIQIMALICTMSRGGWVAFSCSFIILSILAKKKRLIALGAIFIIIAMILLPTDQKKKFSSRAQSISRPSEVQEFAFRQKRWSAFFDIAIKNPILGTGNANLDDPREGVFQTPHNSYLFFAVQHGIPALSILIYFFLVPIRKSLLIFKYSYGDFQKMIGLGAFGSIIGFMIHGFVDAHIGIEQIWTILLLIFSLTIALEDHVTKQQSQNLKFHNVDESNA